MKRWSLIGVVVVLILTITITAVPSKASAGGILLPIFRPEIAPGSWTWTSDVNGSEIQAGSFTVPAPTWRLPITNGLVLSGPSNICHEFTGFQVGWIGDIYMLDGDAWTKLATTVEWIPTIEGRLMACAMAPAAGTYALFAYWEKPEGWLPCTFNFTSIGTDRLTPICILEVNICGCKIY